MRRDCRHTLLPLRSFARSLAGNRCSTGKHGADVPCWAQWTRTEKRAESRADFATRGMERADDNRAMLLERCQTGYQERTDSHSSTIQRARLSRATAS